MTGDQPCLSERLMNPEVHDRCNVRHTRPRPQHGFARHPRLCLRIGVLLVVFSLAPGAVGAALRTAVIGDSLSAEYDALPRVPGVEDPTAYAAVTVPGWESRCWVEVLGMLRAGAVDFGQQRLTLPGWDDLRFTGYKYNFAIPGFTAAQYGQIVTSSLFSHPEYLTYRWTISDLLSREADACVVWIGANELRANYSFLCEGGDPTNLIQNLSHDIGEILDFVRNQSASLRVVVVNLPDLGASPSKQAECPDPAKRQRATQATALANQVVGELAAARGLPVADAFAATRRIIDGQNLWFGPVDIYSTSDPDNNPRYAFTREGLHPNTPLQTEIARLVLTTFNEAYGTAIPAITDSEALGLLGLNPQQPYLDWAATNHLVLSGPGQDPDGDGLPNLAEFLFGLDPMIPNPSAVVFSGSAPDIQASYRPIPDRARLASVTPLWSTDLATWADIPVERITTAADGRVTIRFQPESNSAFLRLQVALRPIN
jgi:hypothetical protein